MQQNPIELFDSKGRFVMPSAEAIAELDAPTQQRFAAVQSAATELEGATANRVAAEKAVTAALDERDASEKDLLAIRPKVSAVQNAKEWIASQRAQ
jgi:hypothetical protein